NNPVYFIDKDSFSTYEYKITIRNCQCTVLGENPFGEVSDGSITLTGLLMPVNLHRFVIPSGEETRHHLLRPEDSSLEFGEPMVPDACLAETDVFSPSGIKEKTAMRTQTGSLTP